MKLPKITPINRAKGINKKWIQQKEDIVEDCFESLQHKYNWVRKCFGLKRKSLSISQGNPQFNGFYYQPQKLIEICKKYNIEKIIECIDTSLSEGRYSYWKTFLELIGEPYKEGGTIFYTVPENKEKTENTTNVKIKTK